MSGFIENPKDAFRSLDTCHEALRRQAISDLKTHGLHAPACRGRVKDQAYCPLCRAIQKWEDM